MEAIKERKVGLTDFLEEPETKEERKSLWEPLIRLPREEAVVELGKIDARILVIKSTMEKGGLSDRDWRKLGLEWGRLVKKSGSISFGSFPESYCN